MKFMEKIDVDRHNEWARNQVETRQRILKAARRDLARIFITGIAFSVFTTVFTIVIRAMYSEGGDARWIEGLHWLTPVACAILAILCAAVWRLSHIRLTEYAGEGLSPEDTQLLNSIEKTYTNVSLDNSSSIPQLIWSEHKAEKPLAG